MRSASRITTAVLSVYAGLLGAAHGVYEIQQGSIAPDGLVFNAIGPPCQPETQSYACLPAMSIIPNLRVTGFLAIAVSLAVLVWGAAFVTRKRGSLVLLGLSIAMLLVGGGFLAPFYGIVASAVSTRIAPQRRPAGNAVTRGLAVLWPWLLIVYFAWIGIQLAFAQALNAFLLGLGGGSLLIEIAALLIAAASGVAYDTHREKAAQPTL
ncbi:MAG: hypothetical protein ACFB51_19425 [Anaerolineae bacterium]